MSNFRVVFKFDDGWFWNKFRRYIFKQPWKLEDFAGTELSSDQVYWLRIGKMYRVDCKTYVIWYKKEGLRNVKFV